MATSEPEQMTYLQWLEKERTALRSALTRLVQLKDGPRDSVYLREKPKAWDAARRVLGHPDPARPMQRSQGVDDGDDGGYA